MDKTMFFRILNSEMELATGCTEPGAVALTGAYAGAELNKRGEVIRRMEVNASTNILKNAITAVQPVDMFPHTHHVENVVRLDL